MESIRNVRYGEDGHFMVLNSFTTPTEGDLRLSPPVFANGEVQFSSYTLPARLVVTHLGIGDSSEQELTVAFQLNRRRIVQAVVEAPLLRRPARG
jgi:hypothetical protein